ncbi:MAG: putative zinc-binding protein [Methanomassiliicoccales archaeon]|nr:putative zinc-binding protein [Methanomassiliicoccales archaeon]
MRKGVVVCGANGERSVILEKAVEAFSKKNQSRIIQFSACSIGVSPLMLSMSGADTTKMVAVNGCRNRCAERILANLGITAEKSVVLDDVLQREVGVCKFTCSFDFPNINDEEVRRFAALMSSALD